jgi:hypothetical protein
MFTLIFSPYLSIFFHIFHVLFLYIFPVVLLVFIIPQHRSMSLYFPCIAACLYTSLLATHSTRGQSIYPSSPTPYFFLICLLFVEPCIPHPPRRIFSYLPSVCRAATCSGSPTILKIRCELERKYQA